MHDTSDEVTFTTVDTVPTTAKPHCLPAIVAPKGPTPERQWYLFEITRPFVPDSAKDILCPKPTCERQTFGQVSAKKLEAVVAMSVKKQNAKQKRKKNVKSGANKEDTEDEMLKMKLFKKPKRTLGKKILCYITLNYVSTLA